MIGGTQLAFRGGWSNGAAAVASLHVGEYMFVLADLCGGFGQLVFGRRRSTQEDRAKIRCIAGLQAVLWDALDADASSPVVAGAPVEIDLMGDVAMARDLESDRGRVFQSRTAY